MDFILMKSPGKIKMVVLLESQIFDNEIYQN